jgi:spermidine synthase
MTLAAAPASRARDLSALVVPGLLVLSGAAGLGYQVVWVRLLAVGLGQEAAAALAVVAAVFLGLALGGRLADRAADRARRPGLRYAALEVLIGAWALALIPLMAPFEAVSLALVGADPHPAWQAAMAFALPFLLLAPATVAMGATLPFAEALHRDLSGRTRSVGTLAAANALGAALGAAGTLALLAPALGFHGTLAAFAALNALAAGLAAWVERGRTAPPPAREGAGPDRALLALLAATGLLGIGLEVVMLRGLARTLEGTVHSYAAVVSVYLLGAALGGWLQQRHGGRLTDGGLLAGLALASLAAAASLPWAADLYAAARAAVPARLAEAGVTALLFGPAAVLMGALFARLAQRARGPGGGLGSALAANLLGGAAAPVLVGVLLIPALGPVGAGLALAGGYAVLAAGQGAPRLGAAAAALALGAAALPGALVAPAPGEAVLRHREGGHSSATVLEDRSGERRLVVDARYGMGGTATDAVDRLQGHIPLLLHPEPRSALFLGLGAGASAAAAADHPRVEIVAVELSRPVLDVLPLFEGAAADLTGATLLAGDARRHVRASDARHDVIVADSFHPARDGAALLYTVEHFEAVRDRLAPGGVFAQWIPLHQFDEAMLRIVAASFLEIFPDARLHLANASLGTPLVALVGGAGRVAPDALRARVADPALGAELARLGLDGPPALLGGHLAGPGALARWAEGAPLNRDASPHLLFRAPASVYEPLGPASERLVALLSLPRAPSEVLAIGPRAEDAAFAERLAAYWDARDAFLRLGAGTSLTGRPAEDARRLAPALLRIAAASPDYGPARRPLVPLARALAAEDPAAAHAILSRAAALGHAPARAALERLR